MLIFGYPNLEAPKFRYIQNLEEIAKSKNEEIVWFYAKQDRDFALLGHCVRCGIACAVRVDDVLDFVLCASLKPMYFIVDDDPKPYQEIAEIYVLDSKVLGVITHKEQIVSMAHKGIDGVIFASWLET